jgi:hypothetical protein
MSRIFISIASKEKKLGEIFSNTIDHVFAGNLSCSLLDLKPGDEWKRKIKDNLKECDILVSFLTPFYIERPWAYVEWSAFWLSENKHTLLVLPEHDGGSISQMFDPFHDVQAVFLNNDESIRNLLSRIQEISEIAGKNLNSEGNKLAKELYREYNDILKKRQTDKYSIYKNNLDSLPFSDDEKQKIALHFYDVNEFDLFLKISERIISEEKKYEIGKYLLSKKDYKNFGVFLNLIDTSDKLLALLKYLVFIDNQIDSPIVFDVVNRIKYTSATSLFIFVKDLYRNNFTNSRIYEIIVNSIDNYTDLYKLYIFLCENKADTNSINQVYLRIESNVDRGKIARYYAEKDDIISFDKVINDITNNAELFRLFRLINKECSVDNKYFEHTINLIKTSATISDLLRYSIEQKMDNTLIELIKQQQEKCS